MSPSANIRRRWFGSGWSIRTRLLAGMFALLVPVILIFGFISSAADRTALLAALEKEGRSLTATAAIFCTEPLLLRDYPALQTYVDGLTSAKDSVAFARVEDAEGRVVAKAGETSAFDGEIAVRTHPVQVAADEPEIGRVVIGLTTAAAQAAINASMRRHMVGAAFLFLVLTLGLIGLHAALVGRPLGRLHSHAHRLARGDLSIPVDLASADEFGQLAATLDEMRRHVRRSAQEIREQNEQLRIADRTRREFLATVSHELRTPMNGVIGFADALLESELDGGQREMVHTIADSANALLVLLNDILDLSKCEFGKLELEALPVDLRAVVADAVEALGPLTEDRELELVAHIDEQLPARVVADPIRLRQIVTNLVGNAIKFTHRGAVRVELSGKQLDDGAWRVRCDVEDTGIGIPTAQLETLFEPFRQADGSHARRYGGTGLGLSICRHLVELMGGEIGADSEPGVGTTFWFEIEVAEIAVDSVDAIATETTDVRIDGARVLVAEDNAVNQRLMVHMLQRLGAEAHVVEDGEAAVRAYAAGPAEYDLILMDCQMPGMDGFAATEAIRSDERDGRHVPIIAVTANAMRGDRDACLASGMDDYVTKPVKLPELRATIARWFGADPAPTDDA